MPKRHQWGFTLAELLIALLIVGEIAAFTIPKIITSQENARKKPVFKETIATLSQLARKASLDTSQVVNQAAQLRFYRANMNYIKECASNPGTQGCWAPGVGGSDNTNASAFILPNGAFLTSINDGGGSMLSNGRESIFIDWNGLNGPNVQGDDILNVLVCYGPNPCSGILAGPTAPGAVGPNTAISLTLWNEIFQ